MFTIKEDCVSTTTTYSSNISDANTNLETMIESVKRSFCNTMLRIINYNFTQLIGKYKTELTGDSDIGLSLSS